MSIPKPGQIRCPTCLRPTPPAAFCTQCGSPIPPSARAGARPRGMDRSELEERIRRRPGDNAFRRGAPSDDAGRGYVPFEPEPEDALARQRREAAAGRMDHLAPDAQGEAVEEERAQAPVVPPPPPPAEPTYADQTYADPGPARPGYSAPYDPPTAYAPDAYDDVPYGRPEDAYAYQYPPEERRGGGALPIIGFVVLCVLALAVGAVLAGLLGSEEPIGQATPSPTPEASAPASEEASQAPSQEATRSPGEETPPPEDDLVTFPDGAMLSIQPCGSGDYRDEAVGRPEEAACVVDGSTVASGEIWGVVVFNGANASDTLQVELRQGDETIDVQEQVISAVVPCTPSDCNGLIYGAHYVGLTAGTYELVLSRNGEFADAASFTVEG